MSAMTQSHKDQVVADMLAVINVARSALGGEPLASLPLGTPGNPDDCSGQRALRDLLSGCTIADGSEVLKYEGAGASQAILALAEAWGEDASGYTIDLPSAFTCFIDAFDSFLLPEMIDPVTLFAASDDWPEEKLANYHDAVEWIVRHDRSAARTELSGRSASNKSPHVSTAIIHAQTAAEILAERDQAPAAVDDRVLVDA